MNGQPLTAATFRHLCRSSPWRWQTLRFELHRMDSTAQRAARTGAGIPTSDLEAMDMNCWVRRPGALRVETLDGTLLASTTKINDSKDSLFLSGNRKPWLLPPTMANPVRDSDGFVVRRPEALYGEPAYGSGRFASALDPVELAGERPVPFEKPYANVAEIDGVAMTEHHGRPAVEAILTTNPSYKPLFPAAPLLFPGRTAVRIDLETAVCVASQSLDGDTSGAGHWMVLAGIDEYMLDDLFDEVSMGLTDVRSHIPWDLGN
ncbi:hypothetical protein [Arthrobacter cryoconiti]|uniref:Uncharacterized protein n=1 Tax=Arthrobacter cryoconiti TaxID=748907 RepID=A0ABV8R365_9MICC|nr:hypothetical protein [Arthrobacter cryoconiti]MCC9066961.1 hypothetical protein [Arthrobacter cryoconiti]